MESCAMLEQYYYTDKEIDRLCKSITVLVDTRERSNQHITDWFDVKKIPWTHKALSNGDYSFFVPENHELNIERNLYFDKKIMVERKMSLDEIGSNFTTHRTRFEEEMATFDGKKYVLLENSTYGQVVSGDYRNKLSQKAFLASIHTFNHRYDLEFVYMPDKTYSAEWIYLTFVYYLKHLLR